MDPVYFSAVKLISLFKEKKLSPVELMNHIIKRYEEVNPKINAFCFTYFDEALSAAQLSEKKYFERSDDLLPLEGIPLAIKDESPIKGQYYTEGSLVYRDRMADSTSCGVERLVNSGAIIHARTTTPEFCCTSFCHTKLWGVTRNPWNLEFTPGGSSGGAAASLSAGTTTLANGSDIGGSIRIPAGACGLVGFKPPYGRNPESYPFNLDYYNHQGPLARSVEDCALMQNVMSGPHPHDIATVRPKLIIPKKFDPIKGWKIFYSMDLGYFEVDSDVIKNTKNALEKFKELGAAVEEIKLDWNKDEFESFTHAYWVHLFGNSYAHLLENHKDKLTNYAIGFASRARNSTGDKLLACNTFAGKIYEKFGPILDKCNVFVCPTNALPSIKADIDITKEDVVINGKKLTSPDMGWTMSYPFNVLSRCPVLTIPTGLAKNNIPTGIQIVGKTFDDVSVFQAANNFERIDPWYENNKKRPHL